MDEKLCSERMKVTEKHLGVVDVRLNSHSDRLDSLEQGTARFEVQIESLCSQIKDLVTTIKWGSGLLMGTLVGFFVWYVQNIK